MARAEGRRLGGAHDVHLQLDNVPGVTFNSFSLHPIVEDCDNDEDEWFTVDKHNITIEMMAGPDFDSVCEAIKDIDKNNGLSGGHIRFGRSEKWFPMDLDFFEGTAMAMIEGLSNRHPKFVDIWESVQIFIK